MSLSWISDNDLHSAVQTLAKRANNARMSATKRMHKNIVDPFSSLIIASTLEVDSTQALVNIQKSGSTLSGISSALGNFHQEILASIAGWENHDAGYDLENSARKMLAEVKNKHNTMNASNRSAVISDLDTAVRQKGSGWVGYLVVIIPRQAVRYEKKLNIAKRPVYEIDGVSFYAKATGSECALHDLFKTVITTLESISNKQVPTDVKKYCKPVLEQNIPH